MNDLTILEFSIDKSPKCKMCYWSKRYINQI